MQTIIMEFLLGIAIGTVSGLLIVKLSANRTLSRRTTVPRRIRATTQTTLPRSKVHSVKPRTLRKSRSRLTVGQTMPQATTAIPALPVQPVLASCPSCGLQAPEQLMAEHFLGSPSHQFGSTPETTIAEASIGQTVETAGEEDPQSSVRHLLQLLVPPRAFGRRHAERTVNPLSQLVQTLEDTRSALVQPLKRP